MHSNQHLPLSGVGYTDMKIKIMSPLLLTFEDNECLLSIEMHKREIA